MPLGAPSPSRPSTRQTPSRGPRDTAGGVTSTEGGYEGIAAPSYSPCAPVATGRPPDRQTHCQPSTQACRPPPPTRHSHFCH